MCEPREKYEEKSDDNMHVPWKEHKKECDDSKHEPWEEHEQKGNGTRFMVQALNWNWFFFPTNHFNSS